MEIDQDIQSQIEAELREFFSRLEASRIKHDPDEGEILGHGLLENKHSPMSFLRLGDMPTDEIEEFLQEYAYPFWLDLSLYPDSFAKDLKAELKRTLGKGGEAGLKGCSTKIIVNPVRTGTLQAIAIFIDLLCSKSPSREFTKELFEAIKDATIAAHATKKNSGRPVGPVKQKRLEIKAYELWRKSERDKRQGTPGKSWAQIAQGTLGRKPTPREVQRIRQSILRSNQRWRKILKALSE